MKLAFSIAKRFLLSSKGQTALILIGIVIGVSVQIFIGSLITGLQSSLVDTTIGNSSQVTIEVSGTENYFDQDESLIDELEQDDRLSVVSESFDGSGFIVLEDRKSTRLNSSHVAISYAVFCLKKKKQPIHKNIA